MVQDKTTACPICNGPLDKPGSVMCGGRHQSQTTAAEDVCHEDQLEVWASEITDALSMGDFFRDDLSHDDVLEIARTLRREVKDIVTTAFAMKEIPHAD